MENVCVSSASFSAIIALALVAVLPAAAQENSQPVITLERTACFGACPVYTLSIYADGTVVYNGERFVDVEGEQTTQHRPGRRSTSWSRV